ncbi:MAG: hypothetical protein IKQ68_02320 [Prevotella sp.]|nr:hypothetical protein [Prevotella sp.]
MTVAFADGKIANEEMAALTMIMSREGMSPDDLERCLKDPDGIKFTPPKDSAQGGKYLKDMVLLMMCDGEIDKREFALCKATAMALGFRHEIIDAMILEIIADVKRELMKQSN